MVNCGGRTFSYRRTSNMVMGLWRKGRKKTYTPTSSLAGGGGGVGLKFVQIFTCMYV